MSGQILHLIAARSASIAVPEVANRGECGRWRSVVVPGDFATSRITFAVFVAAMNRSNQIASTARKF
jgi:hypothetical protein